MCQVKIYNHYEDVYVNSNRKSWAYIAINPFFLSFLSLSSFWWASDGGIGPWEGGKERERTDTVAKEKGRKEGEERKNSSPSFSLTQSRME